MNFLKELIKSLILGVIIFFVLQMVGFIVSQKMPSLEGLKWNFFYTLLYAVVLYMSNALVYVQLDKHFDKNKFHLKRFVVGFLASFLVSGTGIFLLRTFEEVIHKNQSFASYLKEEKPSNYLVAMVITVIVTLLIHFIHLYKAYQENRVKEQKIIAGTASAKFETLKNQLDPHFLFNSLNVLSSLIEENPDKAQKFTTSLSKIYRYVLEQRDKELVSVNEELKFAKTYMNLLKMRFENSITFEMPDFIDNEESKVVPLSLQLLLENCIKHNVVSESRPLHIRIFFNDENLIIENNFQKKDVLQDRKGVGIQNIVNRYAIITRRKVMIEQNENVFKVFLPILTKQITRMESKDISIENIAYARAKERVEKLKGFYGNLISYCCVIPVLIFINYKSSDFQWFWFPTLGWGMGLFFHGIEVFGYGNSWEERKIKQLMEKEKIEDIQNKWK